MNNIYSLSSNKDNLPDEVRKQKAEELLMKMMAACKYDEEEEWKEWIQYIGKVHSVF